MADAQARESSRRQFSWRQAALWSIPVLWCVGVYGAGFDPVTRDLKEQAFHDGQGDVVDAILLFFSKDSDERLYYAYANWMVGDPSTDKGYVAEHIGASPDVYPEPSTQAQVPYRDFPVEYPPGALAFIVLPRLIAPGIVGYRHALGILATLALLASFLAAMRIRRAARPGLGATGDSSILAWGAAFSVPLGYLIVCRIDIFCAALAAWGLVAVLERRNVLAGILLGLGAAVKLWPGFLVPVAIAWLAGQRRWRDSTVVGAVSAAAFLAVHLPFLLVAPDGVAAVYRYHGERGLQIESVASSLLILARSVGLVDANVLKTHGAFDLDSPVGPALASLLRMAVPGIVLVLAGLAAWRARKAIAVTDGAGLARLLVSSIAAMLAAVLVASPILSPQYLLWLLPFALVPDALPGRGRAWFLVLAFLGAVLYPHLYPRLRKLLPAMVAVLVARNGILVVLAVRAVARGRAAWEGSGTGEASPVPTVPVSPPRAPCS